MVQVSPHIGESSHGLDWFLASMNVAKYFKLERPLLEEVFFGFDLREQGSDYRVPVYFISGDCDWRTPYSLVQQYCDAVDAPDKQAVLIKGSGHSPFLDNRGAFAEAVRSVLTRAGVQ